MAWATPENIKNLWHSPKALPTDMKMTNFINTIESQVRHEYGTQVQEWITAGELELSFIQDTVAWIVIEFLQTEGKPYASESQSYAGAGSRSVAYNDTARTSLRLSGSDFAMFKPKSKTLRGSFFSASMAPNAGGFAPLPAYYATGWRTESAPGNNDGGL